MTPGLSTLYQHTPFFNVTPTDLNFQVNVHGGSIALGHPIGCSGSRILVTLINVLKEKNAKTGIASLCIGGGMGIAIAIKLQ